MAASSHRPTVVVPSIEERVRVGRERVETGVVRVRVDTTESAEPVRLETRTERVEVERVPMGHVVNERREPWREGEDTVVPVYEERLVVQRLLVLKEVLHVRTVHESKTEDTEVVLRKDHVHVERHGEDRTRAADDEPPRGSPRGSSEELKEQR